MTRSAGTRRSAAQLLTDTLDPRSFLPWHDRLVDVHPNASYARQLAAARERTGLDEAVVVGEGRVGGRRIAVLAGEFGFLGGSVGVAAAQRLLTAVERATRESLPLVALPCSGGTRMQEGAVAFAQMIKIAAAVSDHKRAGLPYLVYLRHPTTGGVFASWASMGHITAAEPDALVGFLGPRVVEALGSPMPDGVQSTGNLLRHGIIDAVVPPEELGSWLRRCLGILEPAGRRALGEATSAQLRAHDGYRLPSDAWESVLASRRPGRVGAWDVLTAIAPRHLSLNGSGEGEVAPGILAAVARIADIPCVFLGHGTRARQGGAAPGPNGAALRVARRAIRLAAELALPLVTVIDTAGAELSVAAEQEGIAGQIARCLAELVTLDSPTVSVLLGQGAGGAALAWLPADRVIATQHAWLGPLPPEGASAVVHHDVEHAPQLAREQGMDVASLCRHGIVDQVIGEDGDGPALCRRLEAAVGGALRALVVMDPADRYHRRRLRYRGLGVPG
ncbi:carboxyl transferase domain-containing protein [Nocardia sp. NPDC019255]|uniref:carboxyl transferase domain-containing protein n=1 Tax=unclassified Nocardia TaxID=2637762 RepID=UPI0033EE4409